MCSKVLNGHIILTDTSITTILAPEMTYTPFMFVLSEKEYEILRTQIATSSLTSQNASSNWGGRRYMPFAFTEMGVAMLSSVLRSETAIRVNRAIMRAFVAMRNYSLMNALVGLFAM